MKTKLTVLILLLFVTTLGACVAPGSEERTLNGRILLWHEWQGVEAQFLNNLVEEFGRLHPNVDVITVPVSSASIVNRFRDRSDSALGPDILLLNAASIYELAEAGLINDISGQIDLESQPFLPSALRTLKNGDALYGLPFSVHSQILFYNKTLVESPPANLTELQERVANGERIALDSNLVDAVWGLGAFGGSLFDEKGQLNLSQGGVINWLDFLQQAQAQPGYILDENTERLRELFVSGQVAYYVGPSTDLPLLRAAHLAAASVDEAVAEQVDETAATTEARAPGGQTLPEIAPGDLAADWLGVASLPSGPNDWQPTPILGTDAFVFSRVSSPQEQVLALELAKFLTNQQQQTRLVLEDIGRIPASAEIRQNLNMPEPVLELLQQARTAVAIPYAMRQGWEALVQEGGEFESGFTRALQGILTTNQFVDESRDRIELQPDAENNDPALICPDQEGGETVTLTLWHALPENEAAALRDIPTNFESLCPGVRLEVTAQPPAEIIDKFIAEARAGGGPNMLLESSRWTSQLAENGLIADLTDDVRPQHLEPLMPEAAKAMRHGQRLYGIPQVVAVLGLLYNTDMVDSVPATLDELLLQVNPDNRWALPLSFFYGYWGLSSFGGFVFDSEKGLIEEQEGLVPWLTWLQKVQAEPGVDLTFDPAVAIDAFVRRQAAFLVAGPWTLSRLRDELGEEHFAVAPLPNGPIGLAAPILQVEGIMVNANRQSRIDEALAFAYYLSSPESQAILLETGSFVSANVVFNVDESPSARGFREAAKLAVVVDENSNFAAMEMLGDAMYEDVLINGVDAVTAAETFVSEVDRLTAEQP